MDIFGIKKLKQQADNLAIKVEEQKETHRKEIADLQVKALNDKLFQSFTNFSTQIFPHYNVFKEQLVYQTMDDIYSVVSKLATTSAMVPFYGFNKKNDTDLPDADKLVQFLETLDFEEKEKLYTFLFLDGEVFAFKDKLDVGVNSGLQKLIFLNPARVVVMLSQEFPITVVGYRYIDTVRGYSYDISLEDMIFIKLFNPTTDNLLEHRGLAPAKVLCKRLTRVQAELDISVAQLQNGGIPSIVYDKTPGLAIDVAGQHKDNFGRFLRNPANKGAPYFTGGEMGVLSIGSTLADLDLAELADIDFDKICNAFGVSSVLFNNKKTSTYNNVQEMRKEMIVNTILPNVYRVEAALNKGAVPDIKTTGIIKCDTTDIPELHEDSTKQAAALSQMYWLTGNEKREAMLYDQDLDNELMDEYIIPANMVLLSDLSMAAHPVDNTAGDYGAAPVVPLKQAANG